MNSLTVAAILFVVTGFWHLATPVRFGKNATTKPIAIFGIIYLILSVLIFTGSFSWTPIVALIATAIGATGALTQLKKDSGIRPWIISFIAIDVVIIALLLFSLL